MNILKRELKANRKALIIWCVCMFLLVISGMSKYSAYSSGGAGNDVFAKMPATMKALLGMGSFDVTTMSGFFAFLFPYIELTAAIHAVLLGNSIIAKEERDKTTEFIIVKPISRFTMITQKLLAALFNIIVLNIVSLFASLMIVSALDKGAAITNEILILHLGMLFVQFIFLSLGAWLAAFMKKPKGSGSIAAGILFTTYVIAKITDLNDNLNALNILSPFKYFSLSKVVNGDGLNVIIALLSFFLAAVFSASTYYFYLRRDLNI